MILRFCVECSATNNSLTLPRKEFFYTLADNKTAMANAHKAQVKQYGSLIAREEYNELREYADNHKILLSGFHNYVGDIDVIKVVIDDISEIAKDFPRILEEKNRVLLLLDFERIAVIGFI